MHHNLPDLQRILSKTHPKVYSCVKRMDYAVIAVAYSRHTGGTDSSDTSLLQGYTVQHKTGYYRTSLFLFRHVGNTKTHFCMESLPRDEVTLITIGEAWLGGTDYWVSRQKCQTNSAGLGHGHCQPHRHKLAGFTKMQNHCMLKRRIQ